jgi:hypothetical protein
MSFEAALVPVAPLDAVLHDSNANVGSDPKIRKMLLNLRRLR